MNLFTELNTTCTPRILAVVNSLWRSYAKDRNLQEYTSEYYDAANEFEKTIAGVITLCSEDRC